MRFPEVAAMREAPNKAKVVEDFTLLTDKILDRHIGVVQHLAAGVLQVKREVEHGGAPCAPPSHTPPPAQSSIKDNEQLHKFLDRFYGSRIGIRLLMTQHVETFGSDAIKEKGWVGVIQTQCQPAVIARDAAEAAQMLCEQVWRAGGVVASRSLSARIARRCSKLPISKSSPPSRPTLRPSRFRTSRRTCTTFFTSY